MIRKTSLIILMTLLGSILMAQQENNQQKPKMATSEMLAFCTVRIETITKEGKGVGTAFFFQFLKEGSRFIPAIITNKHVIRGAHTGIFTLTLKKDDGYPDLIAHLPVALDKFESRWIHHPNKDVDLAIMPIAPLLNEAKKKNFKPFIIYLSNEIIPNDSQINELSAVEDIIMVGYPIGIYDQKNNYPVFRKGITATHPANDYNGKEEFMIDAACFPGSSGSPVFLYNSGSFILTPSWTVPVISGKITVGGHYDEEQQCSEPSGY